MSTKVPCPLPFMGMNCTETYADHAGQGYTIYKGIYIPIAVILLMFSSIQNIRLWRIRGVKWRDYYTSVIHQLFALAWICSVTLMIRAVDPQGWADRLPPQLYDLCEETGTWAAYSMVPVCVFNWIKIIRSIYGRPPEPVYRATVVMVLVWYVWVVVMTLLHSWTSPSYVYQNLIDGMNVLMNIVVMGAGWFYGIRIYRHLSQYANHKRSASSPFPLPSKPSTSKPSTSKPSTSTAPQPSAETGASAQSPAATPAPASTAPANSSSVSPSSPRSPRAGVRVTFHILISFTLVSFVAISLQIYDIAGNSATQYQSLLYPTDQYPTFQFADTFASYASVPFCHAGATIIVLVFYRKLGSSRVNSHGKTLSRDLTPNKPKGPLFQTPRINTRGITPTHTRTNTQAMTQPQPLQAVCTAGAAADATSDVELACVQPLPRTEPELEPEAEQSSHTPKQTHDELPSSHWIDVPPLLINELSKDMDELNSPTQPNRAVLLDIMCTSSPTQTTRALLSPSPCPSEPEPVHDHGPGCDPHAVNIDVIASETETETDD